MRGQQGFSISIADAAPQPGWHRRSDPTWRCNQPASVGSGFRALSAGIKCGAQLHGADGGRAATLRPSADVQDPRHPGTNNLSDERAQFLIINRLSFMRFQVDRPDRSAASTDQSCGTRIATRAGRSNKPRADGSTPTIDLAIPLFGYQNHVSIDRRFGFIRRWAATEAAYEGRRRYRLPIGGRGSAKVPGWQSWKTLVLRIWHITPLLEKWRRRTPPRYAALSPRRHQLS